MKRTISTALGLYAACGVAQAELVDMGRFSHDYMGTVSARQYVEKKAGTRLTYLNRFINGKFTDSGVLPAKNHLSVSESNQVEWHLADTGFTLNYVLVQEGYNSYHLYGVTPDEAQDCGPKAQYVQGQSWNAFAKDSKDFDFKGESAIGEILFFGAYEFPEEVFVGGGAPGGGGTCGGGGGGGNHPHPTPQPTPRPTPSVSPSVGPSPTPTPQPTCHMTPGPSPTPCGHNVPDSGATGFLMALALASILWVKRISQ